MRTRWTLPSVGELALEAVGLLEEAVDGLEGFFAVVLGLDRLDGAARLGRQRQVELGVFGEAAGVAQERVLFVVVDRTALVALRREKFGIRMKSTRSHPRMGPSRPPPQFDGVALTMKEKKPEKKRIEGRKPMWRTW